MGDQQLTTPTLEFELLSGATCVIRETNGEDEEVLSKMANAKDNTSMAKYLANIIQSINGVKPTYQALQNWKTRDITYAMLRSRIFSLGEVFEFKHKCNNESCEARKSGTPTQYEEDLNQFLVGGSSPNAAIPYTQGDAAEYSIELSSGKVLKAKYKTFANDLKVLAIPESEININSELQLRELHLKDENGNFQRVTFFKAFTSREMSELRKLVLEADPNWTIISEFACPVCKNKTAVNLMTEPSFFFPGVTL